MGDIKDILKKWRDDHDSITLGEKKQLLDNAKFYYYSTNTELLSDYEYDVLEKSIGYENKSYIGTKHSDNYTIKHPFVMGSLAKVQIHADKKGNVDWNKYLNNLRSYIPEDQYNIITPKYDGCSFEVVIENDYKLKSISGRGDSWYGKDLSKQLSHIFNTNFMGHMMGLISDMSSKHCLGSPSQVVLRGEVLVKKSVFEKKYKDQFANTRAFVSGMLNRDDEDCSMYEDLDCVIYEWRQQDYDSTWHDFDWTDILGHDKEFTDKFFPSYDKRKSINNIHDLESIYKYFDLVRNNIDYSMDGIVVKPIASSRKLNFTERRPSDCVAIKFIPQFEATEVVDIEWNLGKTGEWIPTIITKPVNMDGKNITRASAFNYGYLINKKISVGTKVVLSLAGDIIPFIYKIEDSSKFDENNLGTDFPKDTFVSGHIHLMTNTKDDGHNLKYSALSLNINGFGEANVNKFIECMKRYIDCHNNDDVCNEFFGEDTSQKIEMPKHILLCNPMDIENFIGGKTGHNIRVAIEKYISNLDLKSLIMSCNFKLCGDKVATQIANMMVGTSFDFTSMARESYEWAYDEDSDNYKLIKKILDFNNYTLNDFKITEEEKEPVKKDLEKIPVILTGEPNDYANKAEFLRCHPEYRLTGSWKEVKIVFTNSLESNTGKMKKAREKNIEIKLY